VRDALGSGNAWARKAPLLVALLTKPSLDCRLDGGRDYAEFDCGLAAMALMLQAAKEGLTAHPMAGFSPDKLRKALGAGPDYLPLVLIAVGRPGEAEGLEPWQLEREKGPRLREEAPGIASVDSWTFG
jgi:nitroreductase